MSVTGPLHDEHRHLLPRVERLREAAEAADSGADAVCGGTPAGSSTACTR